MLVNRSSIVLLVAVAALGGWAKCRTKSDPEQQQMRSPKRVEVNYRIIRYWEEGDFLQLDWEARLGGQRDLAYVPTERLWDEIMPEWALRRRSEIMEIVKKETVFMNFEWREYDSIQ